MENIQEIYVHLIANQDEILIVNPNSSGGSFKNASEELKQFLSQFFQYLLHCSFIVIPQLNNFEAELKSVNEQFKEIISTTSEEIFLAHLRDFPLWT